MNKELEIWHFAAERLKRDEPVVLLVVAESAGSSPGRQGFKMIVAQDELAGSIGGGVMEVALVERAKENLQSKIQYSISEIFEQVHRKNVPHSSGMICSGSQKVIIFELNPAHLSEIEKIIAVLENAQMLKLRITESQLRITNFLPENATRNEDFSFSQSGENEFVYEEISGLKNRLFIVGGGHCALALSEIMSKLDFHISLFDDRADLNTLAKNEFAHAKKIIDSYDGIGEFIEPGANAYVVVMTLGYKFDEIVIRQLFDKDFKYFGVLGSRAKMRTLLKSLEKEGFDKEKLRKIRTPVGLKINSRTPAEIAVSIAAEIIAVKNG